MYPMLLLNLDRNIVTDMHFKEVNISSQVGFVHRIGKESHFTHRFSENL